MYRILFLSILISAGNNIYAQKLKSGDPAPHITTYSVSGKEVVVGDENEGMIFLAFMRYVSCPVCNYRFHELVQQYKNLQNAGYELIVVYQSEQDQLRAYLANVEVPFPVIGDPERKLYKKYGLQRSTWKMMLSIFNKEFREHRRKGNDLYGENEYERDGARNGLPADFIIDKNGLIQTAYYGKTVSDHLPFDSILK